MYSEKVMDHFANPRNVGMIENADAVGEVGNAKCGDIMKMYLKIKDNVIEDIKFQTFGCGAAIATSSMATEMIKGKTKTEAAKIVGETVGNRAKAKKIEEVVFDRGGYLYTGRVQAVADGARASGLKF